MHTDDVHQIPSRSCFSGGGGGELELHWLVLGRKSASGRVINSAMEARVYTSLVLAALPLCSILIYCCFRCLCLLSVPLVYLGRFFFPSADTEGLIKANTRSSTCAGHAAGPQAEKWSPVWTRVFILSRTYYQPCRRCAGATSSCRGSGVFCNPS